MVANDAGGLKFMFQRLNVGERGCFKIKDDYVRTVLGCRVAKLVHGFGDMDRVKRTRQGSSERSRDLRVTLE